MLAVTSMPSSRELFDRHNEPGKRHITKFENYFGLYDRLFGSFRDRPIAMLEIGVQYGGSIQMWKDYFAPGSRIVGIDILKDCLKFKEDGIDIHIGDQGDPAFLDSVLSSVGGFDVILDDGSHIPRHQIASFEHLFQHGLKDGGVYVVEDCHTSYWPNYGGGLRRKGSFIEYAKNIADDVNIWHADQPGIKRSWRSDMIESVEFASSVVAFRKAPMTSPHTVVAGDLKAIDLESGFKSSKHAGLVMMAKKSKAIQGLVRRNPSLWNLMKRYL